MCCREPQSWVTSYSPTIIHIQYNGEKKFDRAHFYTVRAPGNPRIQSEPQARLPTMVLLLRLWALQLLAGAFAAGFSAKFEGVPQDALTAPESGAASPILNGLNYQSRIDVRLYKQNRLESELLPVTRAYTFDVSDLADGEYNLDVNSYDFSLRVSRYYLKVANEKVTAYDNYVASETYNASSAVEVSNQRPLVVDITGYKQYYENPQGKIADMVMNSPLGFIFRNRLYTIFFVASLVVMALPYFLSIVAPDLAEQYEEIKQLSYDQQPEQPMQQEKVELIPETTSRAAKRGRRKQ